MPRRFRSARGCPCKARRFSQVRPSPSAGRNAKQTGRRPFLLPATIHKTVAECLLFWRDYELFGHAHDPWFPRDLT